jgi:transposase InsO family protein
VRPGRSVDLGLLRLAEPAGVGPGDRRRGAGSGDHRDPSALSWHLRAAPITGQLHRRGYCVNHKRVGRLMRRAGLAGLSNRRRWRRGQDRPGAPAPDLLERDFSAELPNQRWVADLTEFDTDDGRLHLAGVLDLCARRVVGWAMGPRRNAELVVDALAMAIARRQPPTGRGIEASLLSMAVSGRVEAGAVALA